MYWKGIFVSISLCFWRLIYHIYSLLIFLRNSTCWNCVRLIFLLVSPKSNLVGDFQNDFWIMVFFSSKIFPAGELGNAVQDAFVIAVEQQARERLQRLSALKRITPVDMSQLSIKVSTKAIGLCSTLVI